jgi:hypothetical protein
VFVARTQNPGAASDPADKNLSDRGDRADAREGAVLDYGRSRGGRVRRKQRRLGHGDTWMAMPSIPCRSRANHRGSRRLRKQVVLIASSRAPAWLEAQAVLLGSSQSSRVGASKSGKDTSGSRAHICIPKLVPCSCIALQRIGQDVEIEHGVGRSTKPKKPLE